MSPRHRGKERRFKIDYTDQAKEHLKKLAARKRARVVDAAEQRLAFEPMKETRNRKQMEDDVDEPGKVVHVLAIGEKERDRLLIGGEEIVL